VPLLEDELAILNARKAEAVRAEAECKARAAQAVTAAERAQADKAAKRLPWVFPGDGPRGHLVEPRKGWERILARAGIENLRIHDLRRSLGSLMADTGASLHIIGKTLSHKRESTTAVYARLMLDPVREAKAKAHARLRSQADRTSDTTDRQPSG
jgi:integrase